MITDPYVKLLIIRYVTASISDTEAVVLAHWVSASPKNAAAFREEVRTLGNEMSMSSDAADFWKDFSSRNQELMGVMPKSGTERKSEGKGRGFGKRWLGALSAVLLAAAVALFVFLPDSVRKAPHSEGTTAAVGVERENVPMSGKGVRTAAVPTIYEAGSGEKRHITLPDGSTVILNSLSRLTVGGCFNVNAREVELDGEAFFDVAKDTSKLFIIRCGKDSYIVRGTSFNISSWSEDGYSVTTLHDGALEARVKSDIIKLEPGEELRVDEKKYNISKRKVNVEHSTDWIASDGIVFDETPLRQVASRLSRKYQVSINVHQSIENISYTGRNDNETLDEALRLLEITAPVTIAVTEHDGEYYISKI